MAWQGSAVAGIDQELAASAGTQAGTFLIAAVKAEVDDATIGPIAVLMDPHSPGQAVYAVATVVGPLRAYLATAWGRAGHVSGKQIVSHPTLAEAQAAEDTLVQQRLTGQSSERTYMQIGTYQPE
jgi:hypothetical protein